MRRYAPFINSVIMLGCLWAGYRMLDADALRQTNPDKYLCMGVLVALPIFAFGSVRMFGDSDSKLIRPSWRRFGLLSWRRDPLQSLFITTYSIAGMAVGAALHLRGTSSTGFWTFMVLVCIFIGLVVGQLAAYVYYRESIIKA